VLECTDLISEVSNKFHEKRVLAFERISAILRLYGVSCKLFGSCASGITIKDSDIDIAINEKILKYFSKYNDIKNEMNAALDFMSEIFESLAWVSKQKVIKTASIPIIKLVVHTDIEVT
jgi:DNA polymerase sigma